MAAVTHLDVHHRRCAGARPALTLVSPDAAAPPRRPRLAPVGAAVYRRRRLVVLAVLTVVVVALAGPLRSWAGPRAGSGGPAVSGAERLAASRTAALVAGPTYVVQPGDTLWAIAARLEPGSDPRPLVDHLVQLNGGAQVEAGQRLVLPP